MYNINIINNSMYICDDFIYKLCGLFRFNFDNLEWLKFRPKQVWTIIVFEDDELISTLSQRIIEINLHPFSGTTNILSVVTSVRNTTFSCSGQRRIIYLVDLYTSLNTPKIRELKLQLTLESNRWYKALLSVRRNKPSVIGCSPVLSAQHQSNCIVILNRIRWRVCELHAYIVNILYI